MKRPRNRLYARHRFPAAVISHAVWLYFRFPLSLRMIEKMLAARGIDVSRETIWRWALKFGQEFANRVRRRLPVAGDKWHLDEVVITIGRTKHWLWRAVDQNGVEFDIRHCVTIVPGGTKTLPRSGFENPSQNILAKYWSPPNNTIVILMWLPRFSTR
jgi:Transposase IS66 family